MGRVATPEDSTVGALVTRLEDAIERQQLGTSQLPAACRLLLHLREMEAEDEGRCRDFDTVVERLREITRIARSAQTVDDVLYEPFSRFCHAIGFRRGLISSVADYEWVPERLYIAPEIDAPQAHLKHYLRHTVIGLAEAPLEATCLRRKVPKLVTSPLEHRLTYKPLMQVSNSPGYVVAPIVSRDELVGIVHLDQFDEEATEDDLNRLSLLTEVLGLAVHEIARRRRLATFAERAAAAAESVIRSSRRDHVGFAATERSPASINKSLTRRERQVLDLVGFGLSNIEIARELGISHTTVKSHLGRLFTKLGVSSRAAAAAQAGGSAQGHSAQ